MKNTKYIKYIAGLILLLIIGGLLFLYNKSKNKEERLQNVKTEITNIDADEYNIDEITELTPPPKNWENTDVKPDPKSIEGMEWTEEPENLKNKDQEKTVTNTIETNFSNVDWEEEAKKDPEEAYKKGEDIFGNKLKPEEAKELLEDIRKAKSGEQVHEEVLKEINYLEKYEKYTYNDNGIVINNGEIDISNFQTQGDDLIRKIMNNKEILAPEKFSKLSKGFSDITMGIKESGKFKKKTLAYRTISALSVLDKVLDIEIDKETEKKVKQYILYDIMADYISNNPDITKEEEEKYFNSKEVQEQVSKKKIRDTFFINYLGINDTELLLSSNFSGEYFIYQDKKNFTKLPNRETTEVGKILLGKYLLGLDKNYVIVSMRDKRDSNYLLNNKKVLREFLGKNLFDIKDFYREAN